VIYRLTQLYESLGTRDLVQIAILAVVIYGVLHFVGRTCGAGSSISRGLGLVVVGLFLLAQVVIAALDLTELGTVLDYLLMTSLIGLIIIFQPELRRGLMMLGRSTVWRYFAPHSSEPLADRLADAAVALSRDCVGALIALQREVSLAQYIETGERLDAEISSALIRTLFSPRTPLHDGAVILFNGRLAAAGCQLPLTVRDGRNPADGVHLGMRHRAALCLSEETDALLLVVSEETGRISLAFGGRLEPVPRENLSRRLAALLAAPSGYPVRKSA
jgi:diadenylate cyclase